MKKAIVHAGLHRCASTSIQKLLAANRPRIEASGTDVILREDMISNYLWTQFRSIPQRDSTGRKGWWRRACSRAAFARLPHDRVLISEEMLNGTMPGHRDQQLYPRHRQIWAALAGWRGISVHPRIVVRRQDRWIDSLYGFRVARGLDTGFAEFIDGIDPTALDYGVLLRTFDELDLMDNTRVAVLEDWSNRGAVDCAIEFLDLPRDIEFPRFQRNRRQAKHVLQLLVTINRVIGPEMSQPQRLSINDALRRLKHNSSKDEIAAVLESRLPDQLHAHIAETVNTYNPSLQVKLTDKQRTAWRAALKDRNRQFLAHPVVGVNADVWEDN